MVLLLSSVCFPGQRFVVDGMICACLHVAGKIKMASNSRTIDNQNQVYQRKKCCNAHRKL